MQLLPVGLMKNNINKSLLKKLVEIKSLSQETVQCLKALKLIELEVNKENIPVFIDVNEGVPFLIAGNLQQAEVLFLSHIDVVPATNEGFKFKEVDNKFFGRGVLDMKGPLVATLDAFIKLWKAGHKNIIFAVTSDEEVGGFKGAAFLAKNILGKIKMALIPDGSSEDMVLIQKAPFHIKITARGKSAHASRPWEGINAAENLGKCCGEILAKINGKKPEETTATLCQFHSGQTTNMLPNKAEAVMDIRIKQETEVKAMVKNLNQVTKKFGCKWEQIDEALVFEIKKEQPLIKKWQQAFRAIHQKEAGFVIENGASDARFLWQELKIPIIVTSAKRAGAHSHHEWVDVNSLNQLSETIVKFIISL